MARIVALTLIVAALGSPVRAADPAPESLLSPTTQLYVRWDGVTAHQQAYKDSVLGALWAGPTGESVRTLLAKGPKLLGSSLLAEPLLDGKPPDELRAIHADLRNAGKLVELLADKGIILAAEVREPRPTIGGLVKAVGGLFGGGPPPVEAFMPNYHVLVIVPDAGDKADVLFATLRLLLRQAGDEGKVMKMPPGVGRFGYEFTPDEKRPFRFAWWVEGKHVVLYHGLAPAEAVIKDMAANAAKGGITGNPLFQRCLKTGQFEAVTRGYVDASSVVGLAKRLAGPFVPGLPQRIDALGFGNLQAVVFASGFQGKESRALYEFDLPGERTGLAKIIKPQPLTLADLPPLPPDVSRFSMLRVDAGAVYDAALAVAETLTLNENFGVEDEAKDPADTIRLRREYLAKELNKFAGIDVKADLIPNLGDKVVVFQSPSEGLSVFGTVICVACKDPSKVKTAVDRLQRAVEAVASSPVKMKKKTLAGVEIREIYARGFGVVTPTYAVVGDWLVMAGHPQLVQGVVLRHASKLDRWSPDADTAARLAKMPTDAVGIQYCNPKSTAQNLCCVGPLFISTLANLRGGFRNNNDTDFDPIDVGLIPNGHELGKHLFPNLTVTRDDGKTIRVEVNESLSVPLEFIGLEPLMFAIALGGLLF